MRWRIELWSGFVLLLKGTTVEIEFLDLGIVVFSFTFG